MLVFVTLFWQWILRYNTQSTNNQKIELDFINIKNVYVPKDRIQKKMKRQPTAWDKIFADHVSDEGLVFSTYKNKVIIMTQCEKNKPIKNRQRIWTVFYRRYINGQ